ncbi:hypothetical protein NHQ30_011421 [Ciborinia camelliae]|nr:hypothetical protein NHQ30_011421 [Ciborinia camelliae]
MKFLCLPGSYGSAKNLEVQLGPICSELTTTSSSTFHFTQGTIECTPPPGFETYFGPGPHYRFVDYDGISQNDVLERIRDFPEGEKAEDVLRELMPEGSGDVRRSMKEALKAVYQTMESEGPFDGIFAYSEGAVIASTLILDEARRYLEEGREPQIKAAVFFSGWPPVLPDSNQLVLVDECEVSIDIPTCHVVGAGDPYLPGSMALFNVCNEDSARLFDHGKGHTLPRDARTIGELGEVIKDMMGDCRV